MINGRRVNGDIDDIISLKLQKVSIVSSILLPKYTFPPHFQVYFWTSI